MTPVLRTCLTCLLTLVLLACSDSGSGSAGLKQPAAPSTKDSRGEARKVLLDYSNRCEEAYRTYDGRDLIERFEEVRKEYKKGMEKLTEEGKWTPSRELGTFLKLSFLMGQFHGALQNCKIERTQKDKTPIACDQVIKLKQAMLELCSD